MTTELTPRRMPTQQGANPLASRDPRDSPRPGAARAHNRRWTESTGAHVLVVDPGTIDPSLEAVMAARGVHVTVVSSTVDGLVEFGRVSPMTVVIAPDASGVSPVKFVQTVRRYGEPFIVAVLDPGTEVSLGPLMLAGVSAAVQRPYTADELWDLLQGSSHALEDHARVSFGPIELDARAYTVRLHGERIQDFPLKEFEFLRALLLRAPEVLSNEELRAALWGTAGRQPPNNTLAVHAGRLRNRLEGVAQIRRVRGRGYSLTLD